jgi:hypothetical protein
MIQPAVITPESRRRARNTWSTFVHRATRSPDAAARKHRRHREIIEADIAAAKLKAARTKLSLQNENKK